MKLEDVLPATCYARARRLLAEVMQIRDEMGRTDDERPSPEVTNALPREVYFEAVAAWHKAARLADELGVRSSRPAPAAPPFKDLRPGHCLEMIDAVLAQVGEIKARLQIEERVADPAIEANRQPTDVLVTLVRVNRELSRALERPFTPSDVYRVVALASAYAARLGGTAAAAPFERRRKPVDCYQRLQACLGAAAAIITRKGEAALALRGTPTDVQPGDVYDLANLVLGEVAFLHSLSPTNAPVHAFEPGAVGHRLPAHVDQLARTLEAMLTSAK